MPIQEETASGRDPLQRRDQHWNRHQQAIGTLFRWDRENGSTLKWKVSRTLIASRCQNSWLKYFDTRMLVEKKMPEFLMVELLINARKFYHVIQDVGQTKEKKNWAWLRISQQTSGETVLSKKKVVDRRKGFNTVWNQIAQKNPYSFVLFKVIQEKLILEMLVTILHCKTMYGYQRILPSMFVTSETGRNWDQQCVTVWYPDDSALKQADKPYSLPLWIRWTMNRA